MHTTATLDRVSAATTAEAPFAALDGHSFMQLTTFRRSGVPVATLVWFAEEDGRLFVTTALNSGKVKRLRHTPHVSVAPRSPWGAASGPEVEAVARLLPAEEHAHALAALRRKYGWLFWIFERCNRDEQTYLEVSPASETLVRA
jgi:PPOX class probable F420-dependent enzyme